MQIVKRDGTEVKFDISKLVEAISKFIEEMAERIQEIAQEAFTHMHEVAHALCSFFSSLLCYPANKKIIRYAVYFAPLYVQNLKHIVNVFLEHSGEVRKVYLLSRHHKGNTDDTVVNFPCNLLLTA